MPGGGSSSTGNYPGTASMTSADSDSPDRRLHKHSHRYYDDREHHDDQDHDHRPRDRSLLFVEDKHTTIDEDKDNDAEEVGSTTTDENTPAVAKRGLSLDDLLNTPKKVFSKTRDTQSYYQMESYKKSQSHDMSEDVYAFIVAAPVCSWSFLFALYVIGTKYIVYGTLISDVINYHEFGGSNAAALVAKFFLIPVAIAMQSDLMQVFATIANTKYSEDVLTVSKSATFHKFLLAEVLRFIDGGLSLFVNYSVMLTTDAVLSVMLNFAALHFLQDIDDVFYNLVEKGFFGDRLEHMATICKSISWPRRVGNEDCWKSRFITSMDTILFCCMYVLLLSGYIAMLTKEGVLDMYGGGHSFQWAGSFPVTNDSVHNLFLQDIAGSEVSHIPNATMKVVVYPTPDTPDWEARKYAAKKAKELMMDDVSQNCRPMRAGQTMVAPLGYETCFTLQLNNNNDTLFYIDTHQISNLVLFTEYAPWCEFHREDYFFQDSMGEVIPPTYETIFDTNDDVGCDKFNSTKVLNVDDWNAKEPF